MNYLVIAKDGSPDDWFKVLGTMPKRVATHRHDGTPFTSPRVIVELSSEVEAIALLKHDVVKSVSPSDPLTREEVATQITDLYHDGSELGVKAADALLNLMAYLDTITKDEPSQDGGPEGHGEGCRAEEHLS
jgi:hypothetical protein